MRLAAMLIGTTAGLLGASDPAAAQIGCDDDAVSVSARGGSIEGYSVLFQQNGVTFYGRAATSENAPVARIMIRNGNRLPIEVSYNVLLEYRTDSLPRFLSLGRHCAQIPAGQFATAEDAAPAPPSALRVRNLTIANLAAGQGSRIASQQPAARATGPATVAVAPATRPAGSTVPAGRGPIVLDVPPDRAPVGGGRTASPAAATKTGARGTTAAATQQPSAAPVSKEAPAASAPPLATGVAARQGAPAPTIGRSVDTIARTTPPAQAAAPAGKAGAAPVAASPKAVSPRRSASRLGPVRGDGAAVKSWALEATYAVFYLLSAAVLIVAGFGLLLPVLGGFALLASLVVGALIRRRPSDAA